MPDVRQPGIRDVLLVAAVAVAVVLLAAGRHRAPAARGPGRRVPHAAADRGAGGRHGVCPVADPPRAADLTTHAAMTDAPARVRRVGSPVASPLDRRRRDLARLADERWDLLIVGGGIVGSGALLDAASRGLRVALVEQDDIASGTSSRSSRLIHGGLRYLQQLHVGLVREALAERARLLRLAPHLVRLEEFLFPLYGLPVATRAFYTAGMTMYDVLGSAKSGGRHRQLSTPAALEYAPNLRRDGLRGALVYHDAMEDDARYTLAVAADGARRRPGRRARRDPGPRDGSAPRRRPDRRGAARGPRRPGEAFEARATAVLDATGVWGALPGPSVRRGRLQRPAVARQPPRRPPRADPGARRDDAADPGPGRVPRALAAPLADRHHRQAVPRAARPAGGRAATTSTSSSGR